MHKATPPPPWRRWAVLFVSCFGVLLASIQTSALIIAFPVLIIALETPLQTMLWVLLTVMLVIAAIVPLTGKVRDADRVSDSIWPEYLLNDDDDDTCVSL